MMAATVPTTEPDFIYQGDSLVFTKSIADYPASAWSLSYFFTAVDGSGKAFNFAASASGDTFSVNTSSSGFEIGKYKGRAKVTDGSQTFTVWTGEIEVLPNMESGGDYRTQARRTLDNINAVIEKRASSAILKSSVEGTTFENIPPSDLLTLRDRYAAIVASEEAAQARRDGKPSKRIIYHGFK